MATVLIVDDDEVHSGLLSGMLEGAGFEVRTHGSGYGLAGAVRAARPDLILLDVGLPGMSGAQALRSLWAAGRSPTETTRVLLYSGLPEHELAKLAGDVGACGWLRKPDSLPETVAAIRRTLRGGEPISMVRKSWSSSSSWELVHRVGGGDRAQAPIGGAPDRFHVSSEAPMPMHRRADADPRTCSPHLHTLMVHTIKGFAMDGVEKAQSGHPGMPMGTADFATALWLRHLVHDPSTPHWPDRDRFVLSAGHGSMLLYSLLHLTGYDLPMEQLQSFRQLHSKTPGHPEFGHTCGVEVTTGPLGTGFAAGVGLAIAERILAERYNRPDHEIVDHMTYGIVSDGDLMEGVASEAASVAGHLGLGKLIYLYDSNHITIDGSTDLAFSEDVLGRFAAYGWHVQEVDGHDAAAVSAAISAARAEGTKPSLVRCRTTIAKGAPTKHGTSASHGAPLGKDEVAGAKRAMGWPLEPTFFVPDELRGELQKRKESLAGERRDWEQRFGQWQQAYPDLAREFALLQSGESPPGLFDGVPQFETGTSMATRKSGQAVLGALMAAHPTLVGGSADLAESNGVQIAKLTSQARETPGGRILHFGVREHGMAGICNGLALHGGLRVFDATFLVFSDFMRGCLRLSALMGLPVVHVFSHDSVWLGEDGPTHQPVEHCMSLRLIPGLDVVRPADARETLGAWRHALGRKLGDGPTAILVTRQALPTLAGSRDDISCGAYVVWDPPGVEPEVIDGILIATGSEVSLACAAAEALLHKGRGVRVVSMPCWEAFERQDPLWHEQVLPSTVARRLSVEAGVTLGWQRWAAHSHGIDRFGASGLGQAVAEDLGFHVDAVVEHYLRLP